MRWLRLSLGLVLLLIGIVGLFLPVLQGWLMIGMGALLLAPEIPAFQRVFLWIERRFPRLSLPLRKFRRWVGGGGREDG